MTQRVNHTAFFQTLELLNIRNITLKKIRGTAAVALRAYMFILE